MEFCLTIMVDGLEKAWARMKEGEKVDWDKEDINYEVIIDATERPFDLEERLEQFNEKTRTIKKMEFQSGRYDLLDPY